MYYDFSPFELKYQQSTVFIAELVGYASSLLPFLGLGILGGHEVGAAAGVQTKCILRGRRGGEAQQQQRGGPHDGVGAGNSSCPRRDPR